jgi:hypothetical protein
VADISTVLVDLGLAPIQGIPPGSEQGPRGPKGDRLHLGVPLGSAHLQRHGSALGGIPGCLLHCSPYFFSGPCAVIFFMFCCCFFIKEPRVYQYLFVLRGSQHMSLATQRLRVGRTLTFHNAHSSRSLTAPSQGPRVLRVYVQRWGPGLS